ncbi:hypothetical protein DL93DRAFT_1973996 [Clavulina sp. PMI_390]|nr:hypothetical protein DL93DRAFT_1973996 [Clavulina sp. PMI_390]
MRRNCGVQELHITSVCAIIDQGRSLIFQWIQVIEFVAEVTHSPRTISLCTWWLRILARQLELGYLLIQARENRGMMCGNQRYTQYTCMSQHRYLLSKATAHRKHCDTANHCPPVPEHCLVGSLILTASNGRSVSRHLQHLSAPQISPLQSRNIPNCDVRQSVEPYKYVRAIQYSMDNWSS